MEYTCLKTPLGNTHIFLFTVMSSFSQLYVLKYTGKRFFLLQSAHTRSGGHLAFYSMGNGVSYPEGKAARSEAIDHLHLVLKLSMMEDKPQTPHPNMPTYHAQGCYIVMSGLCLFVYDKLHLPSVPSCSLSSSFFIFF